MSAPLPARVGALDGLRGWAALSVVAYHMTWELFGLRFPEFRNPLVSVFANGSLAVAIFFCISGYVLTVNRWGRTGQSNLLLVLVKRYIRLTVPIAATVLIVWLLMTLRLTPASEAATFVERTNWIADFADFKPNALNAALFALGGVYISAGDHTYAPFLWTMIIEFWGSVIVLALSQTTRFGRLPYLLLILGIAVCLWLGPLGALPACFFAGATIARAERDGMLFSSAPGPIEGRVATITIPIILLAAGATHQMWPDSLLSSAIFGLALFVAVLRSPGAQRLLTLPVSRFLGQLSFPLYLAQYVVLITPVSFAIIALGTRGMLTPWSALAVAILGVVLSLLVALLLLPAERAALSLGRRLVARSARA